MERPGLFEFAMTFVGGQEETDVRAYIEALEKRIAELQAPLFPGDFLREAQSVMDSLQYAPPELETLYFGRLCEHIAEVCAWVAEAGTALATVLLQRSKEGLAHLAEQMAKSSLDRK